MPQGGPETAAVRFATTRWNVVLAAGHGSAPDATQALEELCRAYWYPLYAHVRRRGYGIEDAQDLTQEFFALLLRKGHFALPDPAQGRFRSFLLTALEHFLVNEGKRGRAEKRGGGHARVSWDHEAAERRYASEATTTETPEKAFEKRWALTLLGRVLGSLRAERQSSGKRHLFEALKDSLWGERTALSYAELATQWGMTETAVKGAAHRLRCRYRELLYAEIAQTVSSPDAVEEEVSDLIAALTD